MKKIIIISLVVFTALVFLSCKKKGAPVPFPAPDPIAKSVSVSAVEDARVPGIEKRIEYLELFQEIYMFEINYLRNNVRELTLASVDAEDAEAQELAAQRFEDDKRRAEMGKIVDEIGKKGMEKITVADLRKYRERIREQIAE
ncbi:MAG: hypothetical protein CVV21_12520 [Candidatus Goldiibacteriota bacterium HGW-Goldbacteria-1]|jgi:hypothetical protein|nr:MAG: hypothetical protein CVV21_12520 [Candidatus Goldiibacteriota bacterium HGW-Goldbacteria-1]